MTFLVSTHSHLLLVEEDGTVEKIDSNKHYFGQAFFKELYAAAVTPNKGDPTSVLELRDYNHNLLDTINGDFADIHQLAAWKGSTVLIANTGHESIVAMDLNTGATTDWWLSEERTDKTHINSLAVIDNDRFWALHHNFCTTLSYCSEFCVKDNRLVGESLLWLQYMGCHDLVFDDNFLWYNASIDGFVVRTVPGKFPNTARVGSNDGMIDGVQVGWHLKGMADTGTHMIVGVSEQGARPDRYTANCKLAWVNKETLEQEHEVWLGPLGNLNEIRLLPT